ncbi:breast cancer type 2 susceptibility protein isoform X1 [Anolis sagrei]|uniref:breast cancer type 2 susceptibility protein isoform X1 n=1 Tax=Anolis sagrei TaxID=38937 RepID=UPI00352102DE
MRRQNLAPAFVFGGSGGAVPEGKQRLVSITMAIMVKEKADAPTKKPTFFEMYKARCEDSDLGPISLNWFEELSSEAPPYDTKPEHPDNKTNSLDQTIFKTPKGKLSTNNSAASTPMIFKEQNKAGLSCTPLTKEFCYSSTETGKHFSDVDQSNEIADTSNAYFLSSPSGLREASGTPQNHKCGLSRSLLSTPKVFEGETPKGISVSLGAEADPDMSWSSSLATPPTLSPTVIIDRGNYSNSGTKQHNERTESLMCSPFSKSGISLKINNTNTESATRIEDVCAEVDRKNHKNISTPVASNGSGLIKSGLKTMSSLSRLKKRPKKFIYTINNTPANHGKGASLGDGTSTWLVPKSCVSEVSETTTRYTGETEELSSCNAIEETQQIEADSSTNNFHETLCNENLKIESSFTEMPSIAPQTNNKKEAVTLPSHIVANEQTDSSENTFPGICQMENLGRDSTLNNVSLTNLDSVPAAILEESASEKENKQRALELAAQPSLTRDIQMSDNMCWSNKDPQMIIEKLSTLTDSQNNIDRGRLLLGLKENENNSKQRKLECRLYSETKNFSGFKTASNKEIRLSDNNIRQGKLLFGDIEEQYPEDLPSTGVQNTANKSAHENATAALIGRNVLYENSCDASHVSDSLMNLIQFTDSQSSFQNKFKKQKIEGKQILTASQEAEVAELSNILEETGSQFEFTQFREHKTVMCDDICEESESNLNSELWKDIDFEESFDDKVQRSEGPSSNSAVDLAIPVKSKTHNNEENTLITSSSKKDIQHVVPVLSASLQSGLWDYSSAEGGKINISTEIINKITEPVRDSANKMLSPHKTCQFTCSNSCNVLWENINYKKERNDDLHQRAKEGNLEYMMRSNAKERNFCIKEHIRNKSKAIDLNKVVQIISTTEINLKIVKKYSINVAGNELSCTENHRSTLGGHCFSGCGSTQYNYNDQETMSDLTCLAEVAKIEKDSPFNNAERKENFNSSQEGVPNNSGSRGLLQNVDNVADENIVAEKSKMLHLLTDSCPGKELDGRIDIDSIKDAIASVKRETLLSQSDIFGSHDPEMYETKKMQMTAVGFQTASGKKIAITDESLLKARNLLSEETPFLGKEDVVVNSVKPSIQSSIKEELNVKMTKVKKEFGKETKKQVYMHPKSHFEEPVDMVSNTENLKAIEEPSLDINSLESDLICSQREAMHTVNEDSLAKDRLAPISGKNDVSKTISIDSDTCQDLYIKKLDTCAKQVLECLPSRNKNTASIAGIKADEPLDLSCNTTGEANYISTHSALHHSQDSSSEKKSQEFTGIPEEASSSKILISENIFGEMSKNKSCAIRRSDQKNLDADTFQKYLASEEADSASNVLKAQPVAFSTASGKAVRISEKALKKVKQLFDEDSCHSIKQNINSQSKTSEHNLESCSNALSSREQVSTSNHSGMEKVTLKNSVASQCLTAKEYHEDDQALQCIAPVPLNVVSESNYQTPCLQINNGPESKASNKLSCSKSDFSINNCGFFSTASGKAVQLSEESLKKARQFFSEIECDSLSHQTHVSGGGDHYYTASSVRNKVSSKENNLLMSEGKILSNAEVDSNIPCGFSTASGKQVQISQKAVQSVMELFKEFSDDINSNDFVDQQSLEQGDISSVKDADIKLKMDNKIVTQSKPQHRCNALPLATKNLDEKRSSQNLLTTKITTCVCDTEKCNHLVESEKCFTYSREMEPLKTTQMCPRKAETKHSTPCDIPRKGNLYSHCHTYSQTPENYMETEASESARAFMEDDDLTDSEVEKNKKGFAPNSEKNNSYLYARAGKRCMEKENTFGEPPIKRKLLPEFDQSERSSLKASRSSLDGTMNDRKTNIYGILLKPVNCDSLSFTKEVKNPNFTTPGRDLKGFKSDGPQQHVSKHSSSASSSVFKQFSNTSYEEERKKAYNPTVKTTTKVFVPPFKTKPSASENEMNSKESHFQSNNSVNRELNYTKVHETLLQPEKENYEKISALDSEFGEIDSGLTNIASLHCARNLQEMRILKKQKQVIGPQPGTLYRMKICATSCRIPLKTAVDEKCPGSYFSEQLYAFGVSKQCLNVNSSNAEHFQFLVQDFFGRECFLDGNGIHLADGGYLIPNDDGKAGKEEFYRALCDTPGVDPKLISKAWVYNHYKWIIWKLAAMEVAFPQEFASKCLTPERVLLQLKYRYDVEVDKSCRSAIKRITERDDVAAKTLVLCISRIISLNSNVSCILGNKSTTEESKKDMAVVEVTDGWYGIRAVLDPSLQSLLHKQKLTVGQKIVVHGAELVGPQDACSPLDMPESLMLKISGNSTRRARWYSTLGYYRDPRPFTLPLSSLFSDGGIVGCIDVVVQRIYPTQWMEKTSTGSYMFRNCRAEEREAAKHTENKQKTLEALLAKIQAEFEKNEGEGKRVLRSRTLTRQQIRSLQDGAELYEAVLNAADPAYMESYFSEEQLKALNSHRQMVNDKKRAQIEAEFKKAVESAEQDKSSSCRRDITPVIKVRIVDYRKEEKGKEVILTIWRPSSHVCTLLKEGCRYRVFQVAASPSKGRAEPTSLQLTATKKTQYLQLPASQEVLSQVYRPRECLRFSELLLESFQPACSEVDLVGYVVSLRKGTGFSTLAYLSDEAHHLIAVHIFTDLRQFAVEDIIVPSMLISATNLQWRPKFYSNIPSLFAGDLSTFSSKPKETHLQGIFNELRNIVESDSCFQKDAERKLATLLQRNVPQVMNLPKEHDIDPFPSPWRSDAGNKHLISTPNTELRLPSPLSIKRPNTKAPGSLCSTKVKADLQETPKNLKKRKAMDLLSQVPSPPPVKPICTFISPSLKRAFQPPRSSDPQHERSVKRTESTVRQPGVKRPNESSFQLENYFVADEELAMINTQAFLSNATEEKEAGFTEKTAHTSHSDSSNGFSLRNSSYPSGKDKT